MSVHTEILQPAQTEVIRVLGPLARSLGFCLGGGTAVALHLGHRRSVDFDWLSEGKMGDPLRLAEGLRAAGLSAGNVQVAPGTLHCTAGGVRTSFFEYPYRRLNAALAWPDYSVDILSLDDLACMKLAAVAQRGSRKDFVDVHAIALHHKPLHALLKLYQSKYAATDIGHVLVGLTYFDDAEEEAPLDLLVDTPWEQVKHDIAEWVKHLVG
jgi:hypothetical protein